MYALSLKQPWAALVLCGVKTIEIRKWSTTVRGPVLLHAAKVDDPREEGWRLLPTAAKALAALRGGVIGQLDLVECRPYRDRSAFVADAASHRNLPEWFEPPGMYGFVFRGPEAVPFREWPGNVRFFTIPLADLLAGRLPPEKRRRGTAKRQGR